MVKKNINLNVDYAYVEHIATAYSNYKSSRNIYDFTDMLIFAVEGELDTPELDYLIIDEAQDLSALQWSVINKLAATSKKVIVAGDDKQTINDFNGADVDTFLSLPGKVTTLEQSYRVPKAVYDLANRVVPFMLKYRKEGSNWKPRITDDGGSLQYVEDIPVFDMFQGTWLLLARASFQLEKIRDRLIEIGNIAPLLFTMPDEEPPIDMDILLLARSIELLQKKNYDFHKLEVYPKDNLKTQQHKMTYINLFKKYCIDTPKKQGLSEILINLLNEKTPWYDVMKKIPNTTLNYIKNIYPRYKKDGTRLFKDAPIRLMTIHKAKGTEADNVLLLMDIPKTPYQTMISGENDSEAKVFYVAVTRAKKNLYLYTQNPKNRYSYHYYLQNSR